MTSRRKFLVVSIAIAYVTKIIGEIVHEVSGHGLFIVLFGGQITSVHISLLWPYELSYIGSRGSFMPWQQTWIAWGGILVCLIVSWTLQTSLLSNFIKDWRVSTVLFWLAFWTFINPTGYLIVGGVKPFGDVASLIADGFLTQTTSLLIGAIMFFVAFLSLSKILMIQLTAMQIAKNINQLRLSLTLFWTIIPVATAIACLGMRLPLFHLQVFTILSLVPLPAASIAPSFL